MVHEKILDAGELFKTQLPYSDGTTTTNLKPKLDFFFKKNDGPYPDMTKADYY